MREPASPESVPRTFKIVVAGNGGAGKTTFIDTICGDTSKGSDATGLDFGRLQLPDNIWLYLFGTPGVDDFHQMWDDVIHGALGGVVVVDPDDLSRGLGAREFFTARSIPFVVAFNCREGAVDVVALRREMSLDREVPMMVMDARDREAVKDALVHVLEMAMKFTRD